MGHLPRVSGREATRAFATVGYEEVRQRGSHIRLRHTAGVRPPLTIPDHAGRLLGRLLCVVDDRVSGAQGRSSGPVAASAA